MSQQPGTPASPTRPTEQPQYDQYGNPIYPPPGQQPAQGYGQHG